MTTITIQSLKYGDRLHYEWETRLLELTSDYIVVLGEAGRKLHHYTKQQIFEIENWTIEIFPFDSWFTVSADVVDGVITQYYCNINQPSELSGDTVRFVDLDLDLVQRGGKWMLVDEDEFAHHSIVYDYPDELIQRARSEVLYLQNLIQNKRFPFDGTLDRFIDRIPK